MNILAIGNSFSEDATRYLYGIARAAEKYIRVVNLYIGGCPLDSHYRNMLSGDRAYSLEVNGCDSGFKTSIPEALCSQRWDIVTIQQASGLSPKKDTYIPYAAELVKFIRRYAPQAKVFIHQTWAYEDGSPKLTDVMGYESSRAMQNDITAAYKEIGDAIGIDGIIPSGEVFSALLEAGVKKVHRDTFHASLGLGRYALGLIWYKTLIGGSVVGNSFRDFDEPVWEDQVRLVQQVVDSFN